jgi:hypothetical protein
MVIHGYKSNNIARSRVTFDTTVGTFIVRQNYFIAIYVVSPTVVCADTLTDVSSIYGLNLMWNVVLKI